jgi:hypothetical protein
VKGVTERAGRPSRASKRNQRCDCGSGLKWKHCCGRGHIAEPSKRNLEAEHPTRARAVLAYIDHHLEPDPQPYGGKTKLDLVRQNIQTGRHSEGRGRKRKGRPGRLSREEKRKAHKDPDSWYDPQAAAREKAIQEHNRIARELWNEGQYEGAALSLAVAAHHLAPEIAAAISPHVTAALGDGRKDEVKAALIEWLIGNWGQQAHNTALDPQPFLA